MTKTSYRLSLILAGGAVCFISLAPAVGQQAHSLSGTPQQTGGQPVGTGTGLSVTLDVQSTLSYDDNVGLNNPSAGSTSRWDNSLTLGVMDQRPNSQLTFDLSGIFRASDRPVVGSEAAFDDPSVRFTYSHDSANSRISALALYRESDLTFLDQALTDINQDGIIDAGDIAVDTGTRADSHVNLTWQTGLNDPLGLRVNYNRRERDYQNTTDPDLFDTRSDNITVAALMRLSPVAQGNVTISYTDYSAEDAPRTDRQTTTVTAGVSYDVSPVTTLDANIGTTRVDETLKAVPVNTVDDGFTGSLGLTRALPNGSVSASIDRTFGTNGDRTTIRAGRSLTLPNGALDFSLGATHGPFGETTVIGDLNYTHTLSTSQFSASLQRAVGTSTQSNEVRVTRASLGYTYLINSLSNLSVGLDYAEFKDAGGGNVTNRQRSNFNASYTRALTQDWNVTMGYRYRLSDTQNQGTADGNAVFLTLGRQFTLKP